MKTLAMMLLVAAIGCSHEKTTTTTTESAPAAVSPVATSTEMAATPGADPEVDPTLPS